MKVNCLETEFSLIGLLAQESLSGLVARVKEVFTGTHVHGDEVDKLSYWQLIFLQSKANGCSYRGKDLPNMPKWQWPRDTWFQKQMSHHLKAVKFAAHQASN